MHPIVESLILRYGIAPAWVLIFFVIFMRYLTLAGLVFLLAYVWRRKEWFFWKIQQKFPSNTRIRAEILHSTLTCAIFASMAFVVFYLRRQGYGAMYYDIAERGWWYYFGSIALMVLVHDTYFYWIHRLMHHPRLFRLVHLEHHKSTNPTPFTAFSFHPLESVVEFGVVPLFALLIPVHTSAFFIFTVWSMVFNVLGHSGYEFSPSGFTRNWFFRWFNTPTHHNMHHTMSACNYSLYFNFWDRLMGTNHPEYDAEFENIKWRTQEQLKAAKTSVTLLKKSGLAGILMFMASVAFAQITVSDIKNGRYGTPEQRAVQADDMMKKGLGLSEEQAIKVHEINLRYALRTENEVIKSSLSDWDKYRKINALQKEKDAELQPVLRPDQFKKYEEKRDELFWQAVKNYFFG